MSGLSFFSGLVLALADLLGLKLFVESIGRKSSALKQAGLFLFLILKFGVLAVLILWISRRVWFGPKELVVGLITPFAFFAVWQAISLKKKHVKDAD